MLVGGAAVQLYTRSDRPLDDLDFVGVVPPDAADKLRRVGFREIGRRWILDSDGVVLDIPAARLPAGASVVPLDIDDIRVLVIAARRLAGASI